MSQFTEHILHDGQLDETQFRRESVETLSSQFKLHLRPLLMNIDFFDVAETSDLSKAVSFLRTIFKREQVLSNINAKRFPIDFIPEKLLRYFYQIDKKSKKKQIRVNRYEFFVYQSLAKAIDAGDISCRDSLKFRSFEDDLIDDQT